MRHIFYAFFLPLLLLAHIHAASQANRLDSTDARQSAQQYHIKNMTPYQGELAPLAPHKESIIAILTLNTQELFTQDLLQVTTLQIIDQSKGKMQARFAILPNFILAKSEQIQTKIGTLTASFDSKKTQTMLQIPQDSSIQHAILLTYRHSLYLVFFDTKDIVIQEPTPLDSSTQKLNILDEQSYEINSWRYFLVLGIMIAILLLLYMIKLRQHRGTQASNIIFEQAKIIDSKNKIALIRYGNTRYLIGMNPQCITLLDSLPIESEKAQNNEKRESDTNTANKPQECEQPNQQSFMQLLFKRQ